MKRANHLRAVQPGEARRVAMTHEGVVDSANASITLLGPADARRVAYAILGSVSGAAPQELLSRALEAVQACELHPDTHADVSVDCRGLAFELEVLRTRLRARSV